MKKLFIVAIAAMLCCVMLIPVSANEMLDYNGHILPDIYNLDVNYDLYPYAHITYLDDEYYSLTFFRHEPMSDGVDILYQLKCIVYNYYPESDNDWVFSKEHDISTVISPTIEEYRQKLVWTRYDIKDYDGNVIISASGEPLSSECDGSTCPATDMNIDGICDDCGKTLRLVMPSTYPTLPEVNGNNLHSVVLSRDGGFFYMVLKSDTPYSIRGDITDNYLITVANEQKVDYVTYKCTDGKNWVQNNSGEVYSTTVGDETATLLYSTFDWYKDGTLFFRVPLWKVMNNLTQGVMVNKFNPTLVGTILILTVCGVGCLAFLAVLKIFGKRSLLYRK